MKTDALFFFKDFPPTSLNSLSWPNNTALIAVDPPADLMCGGKDPRCSTAYQNLYLSLRDSDGRVLPRFLQRYGGGHTVDTIGRIAFVGFSAAHGFLDPLMTNAEDRARTSALILMDATFGGGKTGYQAALRDAAAGRMLLVTATSASGGTAGWEMVVASAGVPARPVPARAPMPTPSGGTWQMGSLGFWYRFERDGKSELPHTSIALLRRPVIEGYLLPYWQGRLGTVSAGGGGSVLPAVAIVGAALALFFGTLRG